MEETFVLPVRFNGKDLAFPARLLQYGYSYRLELDIAGTKVHYERDEERNWRVVIPYEEIPITKRIDAHLLSAITAVIEEITG
jgi:hypothetical protein